MLIRTMNLLFGEWLFRAGFVGDGPHDNRRMIFIALKQFVHHIQMVAEYLRRLDKERVNGEPC